MSFVKFSALAYCLALSLAPTKNATAAENVAGRKIIDIGCHNVNDTCYVTVDGSPFGTTLGCAAGSINEFRFENSDSAGRRSYASLLAAMMMNKPVSVYLDGCTSQGMPKLVWYHIGV